MITGNGSLYYFENCFFLLAGCVLKLNTKPTFELTISSCHNSEATDPKYCDKISRHACKTQPL